jgi:FkbM family methyltransferase
MAAFLERLAANRKKALRDVGRKFGLDVRLNGLNSRDDLRLAHFLRLFGIQTVLDVGASRGQFARELYRSGYTGRIISFEALPAAHAQLSSAAARSGKDWLVAPCAAVSDQPGKAQFHVTQADTASSLLEPRGDLVAAHPAARPVEAIEVETKRLDDAVREVGGAIDGCFLKIDVQGAEGLVLVGASDVLAAARGLMMELSWDALYENQPSAFEVLKTVTASGFEVWDVWQGYRNPQTFRLNQTDVVCFRADAIG